MRDAELDGMPRGVPFARHEGRNNKEDPTAWRQAPSRSENSADLCAYVTRGSGSSGRRQVSTATPPRGREGTLAVGKHQLDVGPVATLIRSLSRHKTPPDSLPATGRMRQTLKVASVSDRSLLESADIPDRKSV